MFFIGTQCIMATVDFDGPTKYTRPPKWSPTCSLCRWTKDLCI